MPHYLVERTFQKGVSLPDGQQDNGACQDFAASNALDGVSWLYSYVGLGGRKSYCICDAPSPEAIRRAAQRANLPVDRIVEVCRISCYSEKDDENWGNR